MIFITTYKVKPFLSQDETRKLMNVYAKEGEAPGTTAHYVAADGSHGVVIAESDDARTGTFRTTRSGSITTPAWR